MSFAIVEEGESRSFPPADPWREAAVAAKGAEVTVALGSATLRDPSRRAVLVELADRFLADEIGLDAAAETRNVVGFTRYRNGDDAPSPLVELVAMTWTDPEAVVAARAVFEESGLAVVICSDQAGRIIDRLVRPKYNAALRFVDEGLATTQDLDLTCRLGLGYPDGPVERVVRGGLSHHYSVTKALFDSYGTPAYAPPRAAVVAARGGSR
jgi:3-hydroxybutyryl-CoA dehydrogenase